MAKKSVIAEDRILSGLETAKLSNSKTAELVKNFVEQTGKTPNLTVILVGSDPGSQTYVRNKAKTAHDIGIDGETMQLPESTTQKELLTLIEQLNKASDVNGILVQLPLPSHIDEDAVIAAIAPEKDVDGFHIINSGLLATGQQDKAIIPCTPNGCMDLISQVHGEDLSGLNAVVLGRSNIVGRPVAQLLEQANATVTIVHSRTKNPQFFTKQADILVVAIGKANYVKAVDVKPGATVIDVGINPTEVGLFGDVDDSVASVAGRISPVPGGVGPMTIAKLMFNTVQAAGRQHGVKVSG